MELGHQRGLDEECRKWYRMIRGSIVKRRSKALMRAVLWGLMTPMAFFLAVLAGILLSLLLSVGALSFLVGTLRDSLGLAKVDPVPEERDLVCVWKPRDPQQTAMIDFVLSGSGITYVVENAGYCAGGGTGVGAAAIRVLVDKTRAAEARSLIEGIVAQEVG